MRLRRYIDLVCDTIYSREEITIRTFIAQEVVPGREGFIDAELIFWDESRLILSETIIMEGTSLVKTDYTYHFQDAQNNLIFRYDNAPHHPEIPTHPHHKHTPKGLEPTRPPNLWDIMRETDKHLYGE